MARTVYDNRTGFNPVALSYQDPMGGLGYAIGSGLGGMWKDDYNKRGKDKVLLDWAMSDEGQKAIGQMGTDAKSQYAKLFDEYSNRVDANGNQRYINPFGQQGGVAQTGMAQTAVAPQAPTANILAQSQTPSTNNGYVVNASGNPLLLPNGGKINPTNGTVVNVGNTVPDMQAEPTDPRLDLITQKARETVGLPELPPTSGMRFGNTDVNATPVQLSITTQNALQQEQNPYVSNLPQTQETKATGSPVAHGILLNASKPIDTVTQRPLTKNAEKVQDEIVNKQVLAQTPQQLQAFDDSVIQDLSSRTAFSLQDLNALGKSNPKALDAMIANFDASRILQNLSSRMAMENIPTEQQGMVIATLTPKLQATQESINQLESSAYQGMLSELQPTDYKKSIPLLSALQKVDPKAAQMWGTAFATGGQVLSRDWSKADKAEERKNKRDDLVFANRVDAEKRAYLARNGIGVGRGTSGTSRASGTGGTSQGRYGATPLSDPTVKAKYDEFTKITSGFESKYKDRLDEINQAVANGTIPEGISEREFKQYKTALAYVQEVRDAMNGETGQDNDYTMSNYNVMAQFFDGHGAGDLRASGNKAELLKLYNTAVAKGANQQSAMEYLGITDADLQEPDGLGTAILKDAHSFTSGNNLDKGNEKLSDIMYRTDNGESDQSIDNYQATQAEELRRTNSNAEDIMREAAELEADPDKYKGDYYAITRLITRKYSPEYIRTTPYAERKRIADGYIANGYYADYVNKILNV